jgi:hypothetical protein
MGALANPATAQRWILFDNHRHRRPCAAQTGPVYDLLIDFHKFVNHPHSHPVNGGENGFIRAG